MIRHLCGIVQETVCPHEVEVVLEFAFRLVQFRLDFLEHGLEIHGIGNDLITV